jgi:hypothetical protein
MNGRVGIERLVGSYQQPAIDRAKLLTIVRKSSTTLGASLHERDPLLLKLSLEPFPALLG